MIVGWLDWKRRAPPKKASRHKLTVIEFSDTDDDGKVG